MVKPGESVKGYSFDDISGRIIGAAIEVHKELGPGFQEVVYQRGLAWELEAAGIDFAREANIRIYYKGKQIDTRRVDFVIEDCILEIKARSELRPEDFVQTVSYLKASDYRLALLINFGGQTIEVERLANDRGRMPRSRVEG